MSEPIDDRQKSDRGPGGRFAPGNPGGPGRQPGRGPVAEMRAKLATDLDDIIGVLREQALAGDVQAIRIILDRVSPALRPAELPTPLDLSADLTLADQARAVVQAAADGDLAPSQAAQFITALAGVAKIVENTELVARIEALEARSATAGARA